jgi:Fe-S cluster biogenesis protein NfuA
LFIQTQETPNPLTLKFIPGKPVMAEGTLNIESAQEAWRSPLAEGLFAVPEVSALYLGKDFISITKTPEAEWSLLKPHLLGAILDYFMVHDSVEVRADPTEGRAAVADESNAIVREIKDLIETRIRPAVAQDGGDIIFDRFEEGVVYLKMMGACNSCPSSTVTLKNGVENMLRHYVPEVQEVRAV